VPCPTEINIGRFFTTAPEFFARAGFNMAHLYYVKIGSGKLVWHSRAMGPASWNPLPDGKRWIRGMDRPPVLA
jgi:hypothetical protein